MQRSEDISEIEAEVVGTQSTQKAKDIPVSSTQPCNLAKIDNRYNINSQRFPGNGSTLIPSNIEPPLASRNALISPCETDPSREDDRYQPKGLSNGDPRAKSRDLIELKNFNGPLSSKIDGKFNPLARHSDKVSLHDKRANGPTSSNSVSKPTNEISSHRNTSLPSQKEN